MNRVGPVDTERLRGLVEHVLRFDVQHPCSLYLNLLGCLYLAAPEVAEVQLCDLFHASAEAEGADPDGVLCAVLLAVAPSEVPS